MYKATVSFAGKVGMRQGETRELAAEIAAPLLKCGYLEEVKDKENKRNRQQRDTKPYTGGRRKSNAG